MTQSVLSLFVGALGDRYHRGWVITAGERVAQPPCLHPVLALLPVCDAEKRLECVGTLLWAVFSAGFGLSTTFAQVPLLRAFSRSAPDD